MGPDLIRVENGHEMSLFEVNDENGHAEEVVFWCHSCDPNARSLTSVLLIDHTMNDAYALLRQLAEIHEQFPVEVDDESV